MKKPKIYLDNFNEITKIKNIKRTTIKNILIQKYNFKKEEAQGLNDFLSEMLEYFPEKRSTAKKMLSHYWLNMPSNFDYFDNNNNININNDIDINQKEEIYNYSSESNNEEYFADDEDNDKGEIYNKYNSNNDSGDDNPDKIIIPNFNNSFAQYGQFIDLTSLDKANPQFDEIINNNNN